MYCFKIQIFTPFPMRQKRSGRAIFCPPEYGLPQEIVMKDAMLSNSPAPPGPLQRTLVMVGLMGAGKTSIGKRLAIRLGLPFIDADQEIERAAGLSIPEIFDRYGEEGFRDGERRVIARLLEQPPHVLSTGGGAFMDAAARSLIRSKGLSIWLRASLDLLVKRTARRDHRPLLRQGDPVEILRTLMERRYPIYAEADLVVDSEDIPPDQTTDKVLARLRAYWSEAACGTPFSVSPERPPA
jgi:shikimate kinase